jgi:hypothetical protein
MFSQMARRILPILLLLIIYHLSFIASTLAQAPNPSLGPEPAGPKQIEEVFSRVVSVSVGLAFVVLVFALIWGGVKFLISGGEAKALQQARQTITWAGLGMMFLIVSWVALLLISSFTGVDVTKFNICILFPGGKCP